MPGEQTCTMKSCAGVLAALVLTVCQGHPPLELAADAEPEDASRLRPIHVREITPSPRKFLYVTQTGNISKSLPENIECIPVEGSAGTSDEALHKAAMTVYDMIRFMPGEVFSRVASGKGAAIFTKAEGLTVFPEVAIHVDRPECQKNCTGSCQVTCLPDGRKYSRIGGLTLGRSYVVDNNVLCNRYDGYRGRLNVLGHEFAHQIMNRLDKTWRERITQAFEESRAKARWVMPSYAMSNKNEYWAEATGAFFLFSHMGGSNGGMNKCGGSSICPSVAAARQFLQMHDPKISTVLQYVYTDDRPYLRVQLKPCM